MTPLVGVAAGLVNPWDIALDTVVIPEPAMGLLAGLVAIIVGAAPYAGRSKRAVFIRMKSN
jgi:hypothetical protein